MWQCSANAAQSHGSANPAAHPSSKHLTMPGRQLKAAFWTCRTRPPSSSTPLNFSPGSLPSRPDVRTSWRHDLRPLAPAPAPAPTCRWCTPAMTPRLRRRSSRIDTQAARISGGMAPSPATCSSSGSSAWETCRGGGAARREGTVGGRRPRAKRARGRGRARWSPFLSSRRGTEGRGVQYHADVPFLATPSHGLEVLTTAAANQPRQTLPKNSNSPEAAAAHQCHRSRVTSSEWRRALRDIIGVTWVAVYMSRTLEN